MSGRAEMFRRQAGESVIKAANARTEETRRAWLIIARDWTKMAEHDEAKTLAKVDPLGDNHS